jgi:hypothetical protein
MAVVEVGSCPVVDRDADGDVIGVIADATLGDSFAGGGLDQDGVGDDLEPVGRPRLGFLAIVAPGATALVLVGQERPVAAPEGIDLADQAERRVGEFQLGPLAVLVGRERGVQLAAGVDCGVGGLKALDFGEVEQAVTVTQVVQRDDAERGFVRLGDQVLPPFLVPLAGDGGAGSGSMVVQADGGRSTSAGSISTGA